MDEQEKENTQAGEPVQEPGPVPSLAPVGQVLHEFSHLSFSTPLRRYGDPHAWPSCTTRPLDLLIPSILGVQSNAGKRRKPSYQLKAILTQFVADHQYRHVARIFP